MLRMRAVIVAWLLLSAPAVAGECRYYNQNDQSVIWAGGDEMTYDPAYTDPSECRLAPIDGTNGFTADCGTWRGTLVPGTSTPDGAVADIVVFNSIFYWLRCAKDGA